MARFVFALEPLLNARRLAEQHKQRAVARIQADRLRLEEVLRRHQAGLVEGKDQQRERLVGTLDLRAIRLQATESLSIIRKAHRAILELAGVHQRMEAARLELLEATRARRAIELLREKRWARWKKALDKAENAAVDELVVQAFGRSEHAT